MFACRRTLLQAVGTATSPPARGDSRSSTSRVRDLVAGTQDEAVSRTPKRRSEPFFT